MRVFEEMKGLKPGELLEVTASDPGFTKDIAAWCRQTGNTLLSNERRGTEYVACIRKGEDKKKEEPGLSEIRMDGSAPRSVKGETLVVFSGEMDRVMASLIIANGAAAMGKPVTMFFTFWGLAALRRKDCPPIQKTFTEKMFGAMLPSGISKLPLSRMNMGGLGKSMMERVMKQKNIDSVETLLNKAITAGVRIIACSMSMEVMGIRKEELIDGVEIGGVGTYLGASSEADGNLFI
jgi:peroxiredoxin family protein/TusA-related sulfurtransferase